MTAQRRNFETTWQRQSGGRSCWSELKIYFTYRSKMVPNDADWKLFFFWPGENWLLPKYPGEWSLVPSSLGKQWDLIIGELQWPGYCNRYVRCILLLSGWWKECDNLFRQAVDPHKDTIVKGNKSLNLVWFKWGSQWWGILKDFHQSRCILISHWSREK